MELSFVSRLYFLFLLPLLISAQEFNYEIEKRVLERLDFYLGDPIASAKVIANFQVNGGFPNGMDARDRDQFLMLAYSVSQPLIYIGREDGLCPGYYWNNGYYREPGNSAYSIDNPLMEKHLNSCVNSTNGEPSQCLMEPGSDYIACKDGLGDVSGSCEIMEVCPNQPECDADDVECQSNIAWCRQYTIETVTENNTNLGYVPITNFCFDPKGHFSQTENLVLDTSGDTRDESILTTCKYKNGNSVQRNTSGAYAACGGDGVICDTVFHGGYSTGEYDPRYRPWFIRGKLEQKPFWMPPYPFFTLGIGITYAQPFYSRDPTTGRRIFDGVLAVDYRLEDITDFLVGNYESTTTAIAIYEVADPEYLIATSTGSPAAEFFLTEDLTKPCPIDSGQGDNIPCTPLRLRVQDLKGNLMDEALAQAAISHAENGYPEDLLTFRVDSGVDAGFYVSQSTVYTPLLWRVVVVSPGGESTEDTLNPGDASFIIAILVASLGIIICSIFFWVIYSKRREREIIYCDWRFTCAFIFGCITMNISSLVLLGENKDSLCLARMWTFHLSLVMTLAPLFIKVWRMWKLVGARNRLRRNAISNSTAALYCLPMVLIQIIILAVFTIIDPPKSAELVGFENNLIVQRVVCESETNAFGITVLVYEATLVTVGCILAFLTRHMQDEFGESKQLIFSMYNIAFIGLILGIAVSVADMNGWERALLQTIAVFWGTTVSSAAFVIPRLVQLRQRQSRPSYRENNQNRVVVSGLGTTTIGASQPFEHHRSTGDTRGDTNRSNDASNYSEQS